MAKKCVECGGHVPPYQNFLCEDCWKEILNKKLNEEALNVDGDQFKKINVEAAESKWF